MQNVLVIVDAILPLIALICSISHSNWHAWNHAILFDYETQQTHACNVADPFRVIKYLF